MMNIPVKLAAVLLSNEDSRKTLGWVIALILSPIILLAAFLCCFGTAAAEHNSFAVSASFYGAAFSDDIPTEYEEHITEMRKAFSLLDAAVSEVNTEAEHGGLDPLQVKAVFYALCFGDAAPTRAAAANFVDCFYEWQERTRTTTVTNENGGVTVQTEAYHVAVPLPLNTVYEKLSAWRGSVVTDQDKANAIHMERGAVCDTLELTLCKGDGTEEDFSYSLNTAEKEVLLRKMEDFCQQQTGMSLTDYAQQLREEQGMQM